MRQGCAGLNLRAPPLTAVLGSAATCVSGAFEGGAHHSKLPLQSPQFGGGTTMAIDLYWGSGSPYSWRVLLALEFKRLAYTSHLLQFSKQEHQSPQILAMNPRGRVPILKDGDYVVFESLAVMYYLERKYPAKPLFGDSPEEGAVIMRVCCEFQAYIEEHVMRVARAVL